MGAVPFTEKSYWLSTRPYEPGPPLAGDIEVDVAIIGAGYTGLTSAYFLKEAEPGLRVALLEADVVGFGASGRNGGFSMTKIGMMHSITALRFGKARAVEAHEYAERAVNLVRRMVGELGFDCDYEHPGYLWVATSEKHRKRLYKEIELVHKLGITGHLADRLARAARSGSTAPSTWAGPGGSPTAASSTRPSWRGRGAMRWPGAASRSTSAPRWRPSSRRRASPCSPRPAGG